MLPEALIEGHRRFRAGKLEHERERYQQLAESGQRPEAMIIGCCDSRAVPETIFDSRPGEIFVARNVANLVPPYSPEGEYAGTSSALEFAVQALRVQHIVVLGHGRCGGIAAYLKENAEPLSPGDFIGKWMTLADRAAARAETPEYAGYSPQGRLERASIVSSIENLRTFPCVKILEERGKLTLHGAWFDISEGALEILDPQTGRFEPLP